MALATVRPRLGHEVSQERVHAGKTLAVRRSLQRRRGRSCTPIGMNNKQRTAANPMEAAQIMPVLLTPEQAAGRTASGGPASTPCSATDSSRRSDLADHVESPSRVSSPSSRYSNSPVRSLTSTSDEPVCRHPRHRRAPPIRSSTHWYLRYGDRGGTRGRGGDSAWMILRRYVPRRGRAGQSWRPSRGRLFSVSADPDSGSPLHPRRPP